MDTRGNLTASVELAVHDKGRNAQEDVSKVSDPTAQALFETAAEVLNGLVKAFGHFERKREGAWKTASSR